MRKNVGLKTRRNEKKGWNLKLKKNDDELKEEEREKAKRFSLTLNRENLIILCFFKLISEYICCKNQSTQQFPHFVVIDRLTKNLLLKHSSCIIYTFKNRKKKQW